MNSPDNPHPEGSMAAQWWELRARLHDLVVLVAEEVGGLFDRILNRGGRDD